MNNRNTADYVIVGAGSAGCVLASRLSEDFATKVVMLEAGGWDRDPWIHIPLGWGRIVQRRSHDWMYFVEPETNLDGRVLDCARGKVVGGSSSINAMAYVRGNRGDYDRWAAGGLTEWSYERVLQYFRRQETWEGGANNYRGGGGPLATRRCRYADPLIPAWIEAGRALGYPVTEDYNAGNQDGFGLMQSTIRNGRRCSAATAYLYPALGRGNLEVRTKAIAIRIVFDGRRAIGVEYIQQGRRHVVHAEREVLLAGGSINSPQILMLSGLGHADELEKHGIPVRVPLKGVGKNLQDHLSASVQFSRDAPGPFVRNMRLDRIILELIKAYVFGIGFATDLPSGVVAFLRSSSDAVLPDIQLMLRAVPPVAGPYLQPFKAPFVDGFVCRAVLLRPESRGSVRLGSPDPLTPVRIQLNALASEQDRRTLRAGIRLIEDVSRQSPAASFIRRQIAPLPRSADADLDVYMQQSAETIHHPAGTCKMGTDSDEMAVVDSELRVRGVDALRVIDASVMPDLVGGNINAPVMMIAERAADLIRAVASLDGKAEADLTIA
jgi:choline dehydrogenase/4-pyridoxate dehydrogenase